LNSSTISQNNAFDGTKSARIQWQWTDSSNVRWANILMNASTNSGKHYPQIDVSKPVTVRFLVLPVGQTTNKLTFASVPANQTKSVNGSVTFSVSAAGEGPFTYQWQYNGSDISGANSSSYTKSNLQLSDSGTYSVVVTGGSGCSATHHATLTVSEVVQPPALSYSKNGSQITLTWSGTYNLQESSSITGPWSTISGATSGHQVSTASGTKFYRLQSN